MADVSVDARHQARPDAEPETPIEPTEQDAREAARLGLDPRVYLRARAFAQYTFVLTWDECVRAAELLSPLSGERADGR